MSSFLQRAEEILETASCGGHEDCKLSILVGRDGGIHMLSDSDWELERLREHHGAGQAYRVNRSSGHVQLEARAMGRQCWLRAETPAHVLRGALPEMRTQAAG